MGQFTDLVTIAVEQHGLLRTENAVAAGVASATLRRWVADGRLEREAHGLYRVTALPHDRLTPYMKATLWGNGHGVISQASALEMLELCDVFPPRICITVPAAYNPRKRGGEEYQVSRTDLPESDITVHEGVPTVRAFRAIMQSIEDGEDPEQLRLAIRNATTQGLLLRRESATLREKMKR